MTYDTFCLFNELDLLEIRLNILDSHVDLFVICEATETFSGKPKPLYYLENKKRFEKWNHKIITINPHPIKDVDSFQRAGHQKDYIRTFLMSQGVDKEDVVYFGDVDEIWEPQNIKDSKVYNLRQINYSYFLNNRSSERWVGTIVGKWEALKDTSFNELRATHTNELDDGGWHFTNMGGPDQIRKKLDSYDHQEFNYDEIRSDIERKIETGEDYVGRTHDWQGRPFQFWVDGSELPRYILKNQEKWRKLLR
jgi:hypothetical protein